MAAYDVEKLLQFLRTKWLRQACPLCHVGSWSVESSIFQLLKYEDGDLVVGGPVLPVIPVTCTNCGNTVLVNAVISGAVTPTRVGEGKSDGK